MNWSQFHEDYMKPQNVKVMKNYNFILKEDGLYLADLLEAEYCFTFSKSYPCDGNNKYSISGYCTCYERYEIREQAIKDAVNLKDQELSKSLIRHRVPLVKNHPYKSE